MTIARKTRSRGKSNHGSGDPQSPSRPAPALSSAGVRPAKSRGQNFLTSTAVAARIVAAAGLDAGDSVIEIGPGLGILSEKIIAQRPWRVTLIELDPRLAIRLRDRSAASSVSVVNADFLEVDLPAIVDGPPAIVIGNLPFNVAAAILRRLSDNSRLISRMVLMFQREVADRIRARPGDRPYSALSVFTALYWSIDLHFTVAAGSFHPRPRIDAEVLRFKPRADAVFEPAEERLVLEVVRASFSTPRKTIRNALGHALELDAAKVACALERAAINPGLRAETLDVEDFVRLARALAPELSARIDSRDA